MAVWERVVSEMDITLGGIYSHARLVSWTDASLELAFARGAFQFGLGVDVDNLAKLKALLTQQTGHVFDVKVREIAHMPPPVSSTTAGASTSDHGAVQVAVPAPNASVAELEHERRRAEKERREAEARQHPLTKAAIDTFGATIKEIKVDG